jgi:uncharacterized membrane protein
VKGLFLVLATFLASAVEMVEALTIVLAVGVTRQWRSTLIGVITALGALAVVIAALGPALSRVPIDALRLVVGALLLIFGLQWLRKAILRASGNKALHDEAAEFEATMALAQGADGGPRGIVPDWYGFTLAFKAVTLEGLEVAFIALTFGANQHSVPLAAAAALSAVVAVALAGVALKAPLARVPENTVKFVVGVLLTAFGLFWSAEGAGAHWPGGDVALLYLVPAVAAYAVVLAAVFRRRSESMRESIA